MEGTATKLLGEDRMGLTLGDITQQSHTIEGDVLKGHVLDGSPVGSNLWGRKLLCGELMVVPGEGGRAHSVETLEGGPREAVGSLDFLQPEMKITSCRNLARVERCSSLVLLAMRISAMYTKAKGSLSSVLFIKHCYI